MIDRHSSAPGRRPDAPDGGAASPIGAPADEFADARRRGREARSALAGDRRARATAAAIDAVDAVAELAAPDGSGRVGLSRAVRDELDLSGLEERLRARGWSTWLPVVDPSPGPTGPTMAFREWRPGDELVAGAYGIEEPPDDGRELIAAAALEAVVVPCVAVDAAGTRVGFGAGYYDRALAEPATRPWVVVAAFDDQVVDALPRRHWDVPADVVVTDRRTIRTGRR